MKVDDLSLDCGQVLVVLVIDVAIATALNLLVNLLLAEYLSPDANDGVPLIVNSVCAVVYAGMAIGLSFLVRHMYSESLRNAYTDGEYVSEAKTSGLLISTIFTALALSAISHFVSGNIYSWSAISNMQLLPVAITQLLIIVGLMVSYFIFFSSNALVTFARKLNEEEAQPLKDPTNEDQKMKVATDLSTPEHWF